jgi:hypothetical protein
MTGTNCVAIGQRGPRRKKRYARHRRCERRRNEAKSPRLRLHLAGRGLELLDATHPRAALATFGGGTTMKRFMLLMTVLVLAASLAGCNSCRRGFGLFNRGDRCDDFQPDCAPGGVPRATMMYPGSTQMMPGPIEIAPLN